jgi:hypothetical protein
MPARADRYLRFHSGESGEEAVRGSGDDSFDRPAANILPTDFGLQGPANTAKPVLRIVKARLCGLQR